MEKPKDRPDLLWVSATSRASFFWPFLGLVFFLLLSAPKLECSPRLSHWPSVSHYKIFFRGIILVWNSVLLNERDTFLRKLDLSFLLLPKPSGFFNLHFCFKLSMTKTEVIVSFGSNSEHNSTCIPWASHIWNLESSWTPFSLPNRVQKACKSHLFFL